MNYQILWLVLLIAFAGIEGITAGLVSIWFCAGSLVALIATWLGASLPVQIGLFAVVSVAAMALSVPWPENGCIPRWEKTNADRILGQGGRGGGIHRQPQRLRTSEDRRRVWTARSAGDEIIPAGTRIQVERIEGVKAIVIRKET